MKLTLSEADLNAMPLDLRERLFRYIEGRAAPAEPELATGSPLARREVMALLREISFHREGRLLRALVDRLAYDEGAEPPTREQLAKALPTAKRRQVARYLAALNRLCAGATKRADALLCVYHRAEGTYTAHSATRRMLRELLPQIEHAGEHEEPLWE